MNVGVAEHSQSIHLHIIHQLNIIGTDNLEHYFIRLTQYQIKTFLKNVSAFSTLPTRSSRPFRRLLKAVAFRLHPASRSDQTHTQSLSIQMETAIDDWCSSCKIYRNTPLTHFVEHIQCNNLSSHLGKNNWKFLYTKLWYYHQLAKQVNNILCFTNRGEILWEHAEKRLFSRAKLWDFAANPLRISRINWKREYKAEKRWEW